MKICFLLESCELSGGVRVVLDLARALHLRGHMVTVLAKRGKADWYPHPVMLMIEPDFAGWCRRHQPDVTVATFWSTVADLLRCKTAVRLHFCQGCEWECPEYTAIRQEIIEAYRKPVTKITVGPWLTEKIRHEIGTDIAITAIGQCVDTDFYTPPNWLVRQYRYWHPAPRRILLPGIFQASVKGIRYGLEAVQQLRDSGVAVTLTRVSSFPPDPKEAEITGIDEYKISIPATEMRKLYRQADLVIVPSLDGEGFGLPFVEALACGTPAIATQIASFNQIAANIGATHLLVPPASSSAIAECARSLLKNNHIIANAIRYAIAQHYNSSQVASMFETLLPNEPLDV